MVLWFGEGKVAEVTSSRDSPTQNACYGKNA